MDWQSIVKKFKDNDILVILVINLIMWAVVIFANFVNFYDTHQHTKLMPLLAAGIIISVLAINKAWKIRQ
ncbi:MAG: hypothetical protein APR63_02930 [Desulfuromonas sp. SDB]|nr:MAG: hypothetical protein APR63_02930 [Desulfuromonas sp. SDB]